MIAGIESIQESRDMRNGGSGFYGIMRASELIPYDSAIFITTDSVPDDTNLARYAAITLLKKRIRVRNTIFTVFELFQEFLFIKLTSQMI